MHEAAQRFRDELDRLSSSRSIYLSGALVFLVLFVAAYILQARNLFAGYPAWQLWLQIGFLAIGSNDADRFHPGMSIDFLARVGDLVAGALARY